MAGPRATTGNRIAPPRFLMFIALLVVSVPVAIGPLGLGLALGGLGGFDLAAAIFLLSLLPLLRDSEAGQMRRDAARNDANRIVLLGITGVVTTVVLVAVAAELRQKHNPSPAAIVLIVLSLALAWLFSNIVYALHYAHLFYDQASGKDCGGVDFPGTKEPNYWDFIYFAFTLGMTFQTSDVEITSGHIRAIATFHCLAAFVFNLGVLAFTINVLGSG